MKANPSPKSHALAAPSMTEPKSIFTAPEDWKPLRSPSSRTFTSDTTATQFPLPSPITELPPRIPLPEVTEGRKQYTLGAWAHPRIPDPPSVPGQPAAGGSGGDVEAAGSVPHPGQLAAGKKRSIDQLVDRDTVGGSKQPQKRHKKSRVQDLFKLDNFDFPRPQRFTQAPPGHPPSPLFFSNSTSSDRPPLPPRFSSGEAGERMLRQADSEEGKVKTVKLARAAYSGSSPPAIGLPSYRSTPSSILQDVGSPEVRSRQDNEPLSNGSAASARDANGTQSEDGRVDPSQIMQDVGVTELLELDQRPTLIVDLGDPANYSAGPLKIIFANSSLRSNPALFEAVKGRASAISPRSEPHKAASGFKSWILSAAVNGESLDVCLPAFVHGGVSWSCSTLRKRLRVACASAAILSSSHSSSSPHVSSMSARLTGDALPTSASSINRHQEEPMDYFGNATAASAQQIDTSAKGRPQAPRTPQRPQPPAQNSTTTIVTTTTTTSSDNSAILPSIELQGPTSSSSNETSAAIAPTSDAHAITTKDLASLSAHPSFANECVLSAHVAVGSVDRFGSPSQEDIGFFDWTRLPYSDNLPRHIKFARSIDWAATSLGPIELWNADLRQMCNLIMASPHPAGMVQFENFKDWS